MHEGPRLYDRTAAAVAAVLSLFEVVRLIAIRGISAGLTRASTLTEGIMVSVVLALAAVGLVLHRRLGWLFGIVGAVLAAAHGIIVRSGGDPLGIVHILGAAVLFALLVKDLQWYRTGEPAPRG
jgi:hypothetical protein